MERGLRRNRSCRHLDVGLLELRVSKFPFQAPACVLHYSSLSKLTQGPLHEDRERGTQAQGCQGGVGLCSQCAGEQGAGPSCASLPPSGPGGRPNAGTCDAEGWDKIPGHLGRETQRKAVARVAMFV